MALQVLNTPFDAVKIYVPDVFEDDRGFFKETYNAQRYCDAGLTDTFVQDSVSFSSKNVVRGIHFQPGMSKLVQVLRGRIFDVVVDVRRASPTFGTWHGVYLSEHNHRQLYVPDGFANGFLSLTDDTIFAYKHGALYDPAREAAIRWNDPELAIAWPAVGDVRVSQKDQAAPLFSMLR
ncbi:MAG: dTDP-4-dehydrorhamnose 3,5-epimerase [Vulcanimicrobiaceae bacterium]